MADYKVEMIVRHSRKSTPWITEMELRLHMQEHRFIDLEQITVTEVEKAPCQNQEKTTDSALS